MSTIEIRGATPADLPTLVPLVEEYWKFERIDEYDSDVIAGLLGWVLAEARLGRVWLARDGAAVAGYLIVVFVFSLEHQGLTAEIDELYVAPAYRGQGLGARLLATAELACRAADCTNIALQLARGNDAAREFYRRAGYRARDGYDLLDKDLK